MIGTVGEILTPGGFRARSPEETLNLILPRLPEFDIVRVVDVTPLDRIGIPVYSSIRPRSQSLCVNSGKGLTIVQAKVGAIMESIEFAVAERCPVDEDLTFMPTIASQEWHYALRDLCPIIGRGLSKSALIPWVWGEELGGQRVPLPAEAVFMPFPARFGASFLGSTTAGIASGNTRSEAVAYAILELLERDIDSFEALHSTEALIDIRGLSGIPEELSRRVQDAGLNMTLGYVPNQFGVPFFRASVFEKDEFDPSMVGTGIGCHFDKSIAVTKALLEAVQSRLTVIHGGRDDIEDHRSLFRKMERDDRADLVARMKGNEQTRIEFDNISSLSATSSDGILCQLTEALSDLAFGPIMMYSYLSPEDKIQVVRVVVPRLENLTLLTQKIGPRVLAFSRLVRDGSV